MGIAKKIGENFLWRGIYLVTVFVINLLMARILGAGDSGSFYLYLNNLSLIVLVAGFSLESAMVYFSAAGKIAPHKMATLTVVWAFVVLGLSYLLLFLFWGALYYDWQGILVLIYPFAFILINNIIGLFQGQHNFKTYNAILIVFNLLLIAYLLEVSFMIGSAEGAKASILTVLSKPDVVNFYFLSIALQAIVLLLIFWFEMPVKKIQLPTAGELQALLKYASVACGANIVFFLVYRVDYWMIDYFLESKDNLGNYIQASKLVQLFIMIPVLAASVIFPSTVTNERLRMQENLAKACRILFTGFLVLLIILVIIGKFLFPWLYGKSFDEMYTPFVAMIPGILAISLQSLIAAWFAGTNQVKYNIYGALIALAVILLLDVLLIPYYGIIGAAIASSVSYISYFLYQYFIFARQSKHSIKDFIVLNKGDIQWAKELFTKNNRV